MNVSVYICACILKCMYVQMCTHFSVYLCMYAHLCLYMYTCTCVVCVNVHIYVSTTLKLCSPEIEMFLMHPASADPGAVPGI